MLAKDGVDDLHRSAEFTETSAHQAGVSCIFAEPEGDWANGLDLKNRLVCRDDVILKALIVRPEFQELTSALQLGIKGDPQLAVWSHERLAVVAQLDRWLKMATLQEVVNLSNDHALGARPISLYLAEDIVLAIGEGDRLFDRQEKATLGSETEVLVLDLDKSCRRNLTTLSSVDADADLAAACQRALLLPVALACRRFVILCHDRVTAVCRS